MAQWSAVIPACRYSGRRLSRAGPRDVAVTREAASVVALTPHASSSLVVVAGLDGSLADTASPTRAANMSAVSPPCGIIRLYREGRAADRHHLAQLGARVHVGSAREKQPHDVGVLLRDGPHSAVCPRGPRVRVRALRAAIRRRPVAGARGGHQRGLAGKRRGVRIGACIEQPHHDSALPFRLAAHSGVAPISFAAFTVAPATGADRLSRDRHRTQPSAAASIRRRKVLLRVRRGAGLHQRLTH